MPVPGRFMRMIAAVSVHAEEAVRHPAQQLVNARQKVATGITDRPSDEPSQSMPEPAQTLPAHWGPPGRQVDRRHLRTGCSAGSDASQNRRRSPAEQRSGEGQRHAAGYAGRSRRYRCVARTTMTPSTMKPPDSRIRSLRILVRTGGDDDWRAHTTPADAADTTVAAESPQAALRPRPEVHSHRIGTVTIPRQSGTRSPSRGGCSSPRQRDTVDGDSPELFRPTLLT